MCGPLDFLLIFQGLDHVDECGVEPLTVTITLRVIAGSPQFGDVGNLTQVMKQIALRVGSLICNNLLRESIFTEEMIVGSLGCCE